MPRPQKHRRVRGNPNSSYFKPAGIPAKELQKITLELIEFEALRLKDVECFDQTTCAQEMTISQPTFQRLLSKARKKIATAVVKGQAIEIKK
ncbi:MAG: DUF134 domain-containing protein [Candidatus Nanoarchaeia archaeon]